MVHRMAVVWSLKMLFLRRITLASAWQKQTVLEWCFSVLHKEWMTWQTTTIGQFTRNQWWYQCKYCRQRMVGKIAHPLLNQSKTKLVFAKCKGYTVVASSSDCVISRSTSSPRPPWASCSKFELLAKTLQLCPVFKWSVGFNFTINHNNTSLFFVLSRGQFHHWCFQVKIKAASNVTQVTDDMLHACGGVGYKKELGKPVLGSFNPPKNRQNCSICLSNKFYRSQE